MIACRKLPLTCTPAAFGYACRVHCTTDLAVLLCCRCASGCSCEESEINSHHDDHTSLLKLHRVYVSQHEECVMEVQVRRVQEQTGCDCCFSALLCCGRVECMRGVQTLL
jgi:hypothetical protein